MISERSKRRFFIASFYSEMCFKKTTYKKSNQWFSKRGVSPKSYSPFNRMFSRFLRVRFGNEEKTKGIARFFASLPFLAFVIESSKILHSDWFTKRGI